MRSLFDDACAVDDPDGAAVKPLRVAMTTVRRHGWVWLLPLLLLLGQVGQFRHELDHYARTAASTPEKQRPSDADRCALCLSYGHLSAAVTSAAASPRLRSDLGHRLAVEALYPGADAPLPATRNRGPPAA